MLLAALLTTAIANPYESGSNPYESTSSGPDAGVPAQPFRWDVPEIASGELTLTLRIPSGYAVYRDQIHIRGASDDVVLGEPAFPEPRLAVDPSDPEQWRALYETDIEIRVPLTGQGLLSLEVEHQGCRKGLCWPSTTSSHSVRVVAGAQESSPAKGGDE